MNINTRQFWNSRFQSGEWEDVGGRSQTRSFAEALVSRIQIQKESAKTVLDFGCGLGDAIPVYRRAWPEARLIGVDFSDEAMLKARVRYGESATFETGDHNTCPSADIIITSNVLEHVDNDIEVVRCLQAKCRVLYIVVPFEEQHLISEHVRRYGRKSFDQFDVRKVIVFGCKDWSQFGMKSRWWEIHAKNLFRPFFGKPILKRRLQAIFEISGSLPSGS